MEKFAWKFTQRICKDKCSKDSEYKSMESTGNRRKRDLADDPETLQGLFWRNKEEEKEEEDEEEVE